MLTKVLQAEINLLEFQLKTAFPPLSHVLIITEEITCLFKHVPRQYLR